MASVYSLLFFCLAAFCNAVMDTCVHHYSTSIFSKWDRMYWDAGISWRNKYNNFDEEQGRVKWLWFNKPSFLTDAWHLFKSLMIVFIVLSIVTYSPLTFGNTLINGFVDLVIWGISWNIMFSFFYKRFRL